MTPAAVNAGNARPSSAPAVRRLEMEASSEPGMRRVPAGLSMPEEHAELQEKVMSAMASLQGVLEVFVKKNDENTKAVRGF